MWARQHTAGGSWSPFHITWPVAWIAFFGQSLVALPSKAHNEQMFSEVPPKADLLSIAER